MAEESKDKTVWLKIGISDKLRNRFKSKVAAEGLTMNEVLIDYVKKYVGESDSNK